MGRLPRYDEFVGGEFFVATLVMKICPNPKCSVFGHLVYTLATRCPVCKWDLKPPLPASEVAHPRAAQATASTT
jgi:uncharacterized membrane protein YcfT